MKNTQDIVREVCAGHYSPFFFRDNSDEYQFSTMGRMFCISIIMILEGAY